MATAVDLFKLVQKHFKVFMEEILNFNNADFQDELDDALTDPLNKKIAVTLPRGHGKSTHISVGYPLSKIAENHNLRILLISSTATISKSFMTEIIGHIEKNEMYKAYSKWVDPLHKGVVPKMKNYQKAKENWAGDSIIIDREDLNLKDPTINAVGLFGSILSKRADIIICDDVVNQENSNTEEQRQKTIDWIYTTVLPVLVPGGIFIYLGNTWHQDDLVSKLLKDPQFDYRKRLPAIQTEATRQDLWQQWASILLNDAKTVDDRRLEAELFYQDKKKDMDEGVQLLWPERFAYRDLYLMRLANGYAFSRMYQCDPSNRPNQKFRDEWLEEACKRGKGLRLQDDERDGLIMEMTTFGLDLAISLEDGSDDTALVILDKVKFGNDLIRPGDYVIRNIWRGKMTPNDVRNMVKAKNDSIRPLGIRVESVAYQEAMVRDLGEMGIPVRGYHTGGEKMDPEIGVNSLAIVAELGKLVLPYDNTDARTIQLISQLMNEMRSFGDGSHTGDSLMSFWFAFSEMRDLQGTRYIVPSILSNIKEPPNLQDPKVIQEGNRAADEQAILEQQHERAEFNRMMGNFWRQK